ncbi:MAG: hypothetical protein OWU32_10815 [Firmicutes bacterium]|nr:hypothetical protein [Bacillota bacterium]
MKVNKGTRAWVSTAAVSLALAGTSFASPSAFAATSGRAMDHTLPNTTQSSPERASSKPSKSRAILASLLEVVATDLSETPESLLAQLQSGQSFAQIAAVHGVEQETLLSHLQFVIRQKLMSVQASAQLTRQGPTADGPQILTPVTLATQADRSQMTTARGAAPGANRHANLLIELASLLHYARQTHMED